MELRTGCDLVVVDEVARSVEKFGARYLTRVFTDREVAESAGAAQSLAGRFAGKEAVLKVLRMPPETAFAWTDVEIVRERPQGLRVHLRGAPAQAAAAAALGGIAVSISHEGGYAMGVAVCAVGQWAAGGGSPEGPVPGNERGR